MGEGQQFQINIDSYATKYYSNGLKRILKTRTFCRWPRKTESLGCSEETLLNAIAQGELEEIRHERT